MFLRGFEVWEKAKSVGWKPEENVQTNETNENPTKKTFSRDTTKKKI
jgi:hypothetical protein